MEVHQGLKPKRGAVTILGLSSQEEIIDEDIDERVWENLRKASQFRNLKQKTNCIATLDIDTAVLLHVPCVSSAEDKIYSKLMQAYRGPYFVKKRIGQCAYLLRDKKGKDIGVYNLKNLKVYKC